LTPRNHSIRRLKSARILPFSKSTSHLTPNGQAEELALSAALELALKTPHFYFANSLDLTRPVQGRWVQGGKAALLGEVEAIDLFTK